MNRSAQMTQQIATLALSAVLAAGAAVAVACAVWGTAPDTPEIVAPLDPQELESQVLALDCQLAANAPSALCSTPITVADQTPYR